MYITYLFAVRCKDKGDENNKRGRIVKLIQNTPTSTGSQPVSTIATNQLLRLQPADLQPCVFLLSECTKRLHNFRSQGCLPYLKTLL